MTKKNENELQEQLKLYDGAVKLFITALTLYFNGTVKKCKYPVLQVRSHGRTIYAVVCEDEEATRSSHSDYYWIGEVSGETDGKPWLKLDAICKIAIKWVFCYMQNLNPYKFAADFGRLEYFAEWFDRGFNDLQNASLKYKEPMLVLYSNRKDNFFLSVREQGEENETARVKIYPFNSLYVFDIDIDDSDVYFTEGVMFLDQRKVYRIAAEWIFGILK